MILRTKNKCIMEKMTHSYSKKTLTTLILCVFFSQTGYAKKPEIEKRSLSTPKTAQSNVQSNTSTEWQLYQKIIELDEEITQLRDKVERMEGALEKAKKSQNQFQANINQRLTNQEDALVEMSDQLDAKENPADANNPDDKTKNTDNQDASTNGTESNDSSTKEWSSTDSAKTIKPSVTKVKPKVPLPAPATKASKPDSSSEQKSNPEETAKKTYLAAYDAFKRNGRNAGVAKMQAFIKKHPTSKLIPSAHFWVGEFYLSGSKPNFKAAKESFMTVVKQYPTSQKIPKSLYRLGYIAKIDKKDKLAKQFMQNLIKKFPDTREAGLAKAFLERYGE